MNQLQTYIGKIILREYGVCSVHHDGKEYIVSNKEHGEIKRTSQDMIQEVLKHIHNQNRRLRHE